MIDDAEPRFLLITTQTWTQVTRLALRLLAYGGRVSALCPAASDLRRLPGLEACRVFRPSDLPGSLEAAVEATGATHLVPGDDLAVRLLHRLSQRSEEHHRRVENSIGPSRFYPLIRSRSALLALAREEGIAIPETARVRTPEEVKQWARGRRLPFLLKRDGTFGGGGVRVIESEAGVEEACRDFFGSPARTRRLPTLMRFGKPPALALPADWSDGAEISVQSWVEGVAANAMFACERGKILGGVQARVVASRGKTGPSLLIRLMEDERIVRAGSQLAAKLELTGFFGLDFILEHGTGIPMLIEMNPRCTQLGHVGVRGQTELAGLLWARWAGRPAPPCGGEELNDEICFYPQGEVSAAGSRFLETSRIDVCGPDRASVDELLRGSPTPLARTWRAGRRRLKRLKHGWATPAPAPIHYFEAEAGPAAQTEPPAGMPLGGGRPRISLG